MGYASALAWVLLLAILFATLLMLRVSRNRVYYESER
jgi:ABC-type sugar transport system permease subunit